MLVRYRWLLLSAIVTAPLAAAGCVSDSDGAPRGFPWVVESDVPRSRGDLQNPLALDLTFAHWQEQLGHLPEAEESYQRVLKQDSDSIDARLGLARLEQLRGNAAEAEQAFLKIVEDNSGCVPAIDALGQFYAAEQRWNEAISTLARATEAAPQDVVCRHHYAVVLAKAGRPQAAFAQFSQLVSEAEAHYNIGYILHEQGRSDLAEREFLLAVTLQPDLKAAQTMLDELRRGRQGSPLIAQAAGAMPPAHAATVTQTAAVGVEPAQATQQVSTAAATVNRPQPAVQPPTQQRSTYQQPVNPIPSTSAMPSPLASNAAATPSLVSPAAQSAEVPPVSHGSPSPAAQTADGAASAQWQMPVRRDPASIFEEQLRNQVPASESH